MALQRLRQTVQHLANEGTSDSTLPALSLVRGRTDVALLDLSMGQVLERQARKYPHREAIVVPWTGVRLTFQQLNERSKSVARGLLALGVGFQDRVGVYAGSCERFAELFYAVSRIGAILVVLSPLYTHVECENALRHSGCKVLFTAADVGRRSRTRILNRLADVLKNGSTSLPDLQRVVIIRGDTAVVGPFTTYEDMIHDGATISSNVVDELTRSISCHEVCILQYTSGTTGAPKATMSTHYNVINNGNLMGYVMRLKGGQDVICCPPPLYHAFGLILGLLCCFMHGVTMVVPSWTFDPAIALQTVIDEQCTGLLGVPTMLVGMLQVYRRERERFGAIQLRTGIAAGTPVPRHLMEELQKTFGLPEFVIVYGMTELAGASFITSVDDEIEEKLSTVGRVIPHTSAKVIAPDGQIVPIGVRGELCMAGFGVQKGYYQNVEKTNEIMIRDGEGTVWLHSGDEATIDERGYCKITGRIKDMIIRGGENIYPFEIEQRLGQHAAISQASVVGLRDDTYGEVVAAFLEPHPVAQRPSDAEVREWVRATLGKHNAPVHVRWVGTVTDDDIVEFPKTSSGKIKKGELRMIGNAFVDRKRGS